MPLYQLFNSIVYKMKKIFFSFLASAIMFASCKEQCNVVSVDAALAKATEYVGKSIELGGKLAVQPIDSTNTTVLYFATSCTDCSKAVKLNAAANVSLDTLKNGECYVFTGTLSSKDIDTTALKEMQAKGQCCPVLAEKVAAEGKVTCYMFDVTSAKATTCDKIQACCAKEGESCKKENATCCDSTKK